MSPLLLRSSLRHFARHPWQAGLAVAGVALGVAVALSIELANGSALAAFRLSSDAVTGRATHEIVAGSAGIPEEVYRDLRIDRGLREIAPMPPMAPVVEGWIRPAERRERTLRLLGLDPFAEAGFRDFVDAGLEGTPAVADLLTRPGAVVLAGATARELGLEVGDRFRVEAGGAAAELVLVHRMEGLTGPASSAAAELALADLSTAQEALGFEGRLSRIDLIVPEGAAGQALLAGLRERLSPGLEIARSSARGETAEEMTRAFRINLRALALLALLCGAFLIYNTITFAVVQRRRLIGTLRALGVTRGEIFALVLGEAAAIGLLGSALGIALGRALGRALLAQVTRTINDHYFVVAVRDVELPPEAFALALALGLGGSLLAALAPAAEAVAASPRSALARAELEGRVHRAVPAVTAAGIALALGGGALLAWGGEGLPSSFGGLFAVLFGLALLTPAATMGLTALATPLAGLAFGQLGRMASRGIVAALSRTAIAIAALMMAVAVAVGVDVTIRSFRGTVARWLEYSLPAELYVSTAGAAAGGRAAARPGLDSEAVAALRALAGVERANTVRQVEVGSPEGPLRLLAYDLDARGRGAFAFRAGSPAAAWRAFEGGEAVLISEPLAFRRGLAPGDRLELSTPHGVRAFEVAGVYVDYASERGAVMLDRRAYDRLWDDPFFTAVSLYAAPGADAAALAEAARTALGAERRALVRSNGEIRRQSLEVFDRTFVVTGVLRLLAVAVAFMGVLSALTALQLERARELGVLRALGLTPGQVWTVVTSQTGLLGLAAGLLAIPTGLAMAAINIYVINRRSFGWTLEMAVAPEALAGAVALAVGAALLAGLYPAWRMARTSPAEALRGR